MDEAVQPAGSPTWLRWLFLVAALFTFAAVALGSVVCATDSSAACPNWPGCYIGKVAPEAHLNPVLEFVHRVVAVTSGPLLLACALVGLRSRDLLVRSLPWLAVFGALTAGVLGMLTIKTGISTTAAALDLTASLTAMVAITVAAACVGRAPRTWCPDGPATWASAAVLGLLVFHVMSIFVAGPGSLTRCLSWPVWRLVDADGSHSPQRLRMALGVLAIGLVVVAALLVIRIPGRRMLGVLALLFTILELLLGVFVVGAGDAGLPLKAVYAATAGAVLCTMGWLAALGSIHHAGGADRPDDN